MSKLADILDDFRKQVSSPLITHEKEMHEYINDWRGNFSGKAIAVIFPKSTLEVSKIVLTAQKYRISLVPQGGNTGLCGGATPDKTGTSVIISFKKFNKIRSIDTTGNIITVESGCTLEDIQNFVIENDRIFPIDLAAKGSCTIGGNLATNAGGNNVIKYGSTRDLVLGIEAVLPNGKIINTLTSLYKDNTGFALHKLFVGSEGTIAFITAATIKIFPKPKAKKTVIIKLKNIASALESLKYIQTSTGNGIEAFEIMTKPILEIIHKQFPNFQKPFQKIPNLLAIVEFINFSEYEVKVQKNGQTLFEEKVLNLFEELFNIGLIEDGVIAQSISQSKEIWDIRENANIAQKQEGYQIKLDVSLPIHKIEEFWYDTEKKLIEEYPNIRICSFGHLGDGNLHYNLMGETGEDQIFYLKRKNFEQIVYKNVFNLNGSFSAEHGIGQLKKNELKLYKDQNSLDLMKKIKSLIDPENIFNPGKVF